MMPLHVCYISQEYPPETGWGGIGSYTYEMAHGMVQAGHRVTVLAAAAADETVQDDGGVRVHRILPAPDWAAYRGLWRLNRVWPGFAWAAARRLRLVDAESRIDLVEAPDGRADGLFVPFGRRRPRLVVRLHTPWIFVDRLSGVVATRAKRAVYRQEALAIHRADAVTSPCQAMVDLARTWIPLARRPLFVVPNPVNTVTFCPGTETGPRAPEVLFAGRLERRKGIAVIADALLQVLDRVPGARFRFVGADCADRDGSSWRAKITAAAAAARDGRVLFEQVTRSSMVDRYRAAAVCILASEWENFPYTLLEAMACGTPVAATRTGGHPEMIEDGASGILVPAAEPQALADAICALLTDTARREQMGANARIRTLEQFSVQRVVPQMVALYLRVLGIAGDGT